jgi:Family of unknown function (DUF6460)
LTFNGIEGAYYDAWPLGFDPWNIIPSIKRFVLGIWDMGFDAVRWVWRYFLLGAIVVIPIWLIMRLVRAPRGR